MALGTPVRVGVALIVEDDVSLGDALRRFLEERVTAVDLTHSRKEAERKLREQQFDAALVDLALPDGSGLQVLDALWAQPTMPRVVVISGAATPDVAFRLAQMGVRRFVPKPLNLELLARVWEETVNLAPDVRPFLRGSAGHVDLRTMENLVRQSMIDEALAMARGSRRRASSLLGISRQLLQHILRSGPRRPE
jgi:DNA-binding NtrC family response regulator